MNDEVKSRGHMALYAHVCSGHDAYGVIVYVELENLD